MKTVQKLLFLFLSLSLTSSYAANRYWVASSSSNWNNTSNWSTSSGGSGGASVPSTGDYVYFTVAGQGDCILDTPAAFDGITIYSNYSGTIDLAGFSFNPTVSGNHSCTFRGGTISDTPGTSSVSYTTTNQTRFDGTTFNAAINVVSGRVRFDGGIFNGPVIVEDNGASSTNGDGGCTFNSTFKVTNSGSSYFLMGYTNPDIFNGDVTLINNSSSRIRMAYASAGNQFNGNIALASSNGSGIYFGENGGQTSLATSRTITVHPSGFTAGELRFKNFVQNGTTTQNLTLTGTALLRIQTGTIFNGNVYFVSPRLLLNGGTFAGPSSFEKTGSVDDRSNGNNTFNNSTTLTNSGTGYLLLGNNTKDIFNGDLILNNTGSRHIYLAYDGLGHEINGNLTVNNLSSGTSSYIYISSKNTASINITGNVSITNSSSSANSYVILGESGDINIGGTLSINNSPTGASGHVNIASGSNSNITISGESTVTNSGTGTTKRIYLGYYGSIVFNDNLTINNNSTATNSEVYLHDRSSSNNIYNGNIILSSNSTDGIRFGSSSGFGTLSSTKTLSISGSGFNSGNLYLKNLTQVGNTPQSLTLLNSCILYIYNSTFGGSLSVTTPRIFFRDNVFSGTTLLHKTGASDDYSHGGNTFNGNVEIKNTGAGYLLTGASNPDTFQANVTINNLGSRHIYLAHRTQNNFIGGNLEVNNTTSSTNSTNIYLATDSIASLTVNGSVTINNNGTGTSSSIYLGRTGDVAIANNLNITNSHTGTNGYIYVANSQYSNVTIGGQTNITNSGAGTSKRIYLGDHGDVILNDDLNVTNSSTASNSEIYLNHQSNSQNQYNGDIQLSSTVSGCDGIRFGQNNGSGLLANSKVITIGGSGFISGQLQLRNFTQIGSTPQNITLTGTGYFYAYNSNFGGNVDFRAPRINSLKTVYSGNSYLEKTGGIGDDYSAGENTFTGNTTIVNSGSRLFVLGNGTLDNFLSNVSLINSGTSSIYFARSGAGHSIAGNLNMTNSGSGSGTNYILIGDNASTTLSIGGNVSMTSNGSAKYLRTYLANNGAITVNGNVNIENSGSGTYSVSMLSNASTSSLTINGNTNVINNGNATTRNRVFLGNNGDVTFNGTLNIENYAGTADSDVNCNHGANSTNLYNDNITISSKHTSCEGIFFGSSGGSGTLAATKTITIPGTDVTNFIGGRLYFRNFTQTGNTPHSFELASTASYIYNYNSNWGGNISFISPRTYTRNTTFNGTTYIEKTGSANDDSYGGNTFMGNTEIKLNNNVGTGRLYLSNNSSSTFGGNLILKNSGSFSDLILGRTPGTYTISGDLTLINESTGTGSQQLYLASHASAIFNISGNTTINNTSSGTSGSHHIYLSNTGTVNIAGNTTVTNSGIGGEYKYIYLGNSGNITIGGDLIMTNSSTANYAQCIIGNSTSSLVTVNGSTTLNNSGSGTDKRCYLGNYGDLILNGDLDITNNSSANYSEIYLSYRPSCSNQFNGNITLKSTQTSGDGFVFGNSGGLSTLAATKTISIPGVDALNFIGGNLILKNFTQVGNTPQSLELGSTAAYLINQDNNWGGDITFKAPRVTTRGTTYNNSAYIEKTGASSDASVGGNTFMGNTELKNSGTGYLLMGNGVADNFQSNVVLNNNGTNNMYLAYNSAGNTVNGDLTINNSATGGNAYVYLSDRSSSTLTVSGLTTVNNSASSSQGYVILGDDGDITFNGGLQLTNNGTTTNGHILLANNTSSQVTINGVSTVTNNSAGTYKRVYLGNSGDATFNGDLSLTNNSSATNSEIFCNYNSNSSNTYNGNIILASTHSSADGIRFGQNGGNGDLANTKALTIHGSGFIAGQLTFRNFTQTGNATQDLTLTGTSYLYMRNSTWNGPVDLKAPRIFIRQNEYNNTTSLEKTGATNDASTGGNVFNDDVTIKNSGTSYFMPSNGTSNDFNGNVSYIKTGSGLIYPSYNSTCTYAKNINISSPTAIRFGAASNGRVVLDGNSAQSINTIGATPTPEFRDVQTNNNNDDITLNTPIIILKELDLDNGNIITTSTNVIYMNDNTSVSSVSDNAYVDGPLVKIGNDAFTFPVGNGGYYAPITMSKPSSSSSRFEGKYVHIAPHNDGFDSSAVTSGLDNISNTEYWILNRLVGSNNVRTTLGWANTRSGHIGSGSLCDIRVARWDGTKWINEGNGGTTGNTTAGTIITGTSEDCASSTRINSWVNDYPLTLAADSNFITWDGTAYDGGSGTGSAPSTADVGRTLKVYAPDAVLPVDANVAKVIVTPARKAFHSRWNSFRSK